jgi:hypothetical protein
MVGEPRDVVFVGGDKAPDPVRGKKPRRPGGRDAQVMQGCQPVGSEGRFREDGALLGEVNEAPDRGVVSLLCPLADHSRPLQRDRRVGRRVAMQADGTPPRSALDRPRPPVRSLG